jgi:hypothetical protein
VFLFVNRKASKIIGAAQTFEERTKGERIEGA